MADNVRALGDQLREVTIKKVNGLATFGIEHIFFPNVSSAVLPISRTVMFFSCMFLW